MGSSFPELNERANHLLKTLIDEYIQGGQPIGSTALARSSGLKLSSATIRNAMASLEEMGFIRSPHTSAGRVPTSKGYRVFVDSLLSVKSQEEDMLTVVKESFQAAQQNSSGLIQSASGLLSSMTQMAGIVTLPRREEIAIRHLEFMRLSPVQVLVILVLENGDIQNRLVDVDKDYSANELQQTTNYLNEFLAGKSLQQARHYLLDEMKQLQTDVNDFMRNCIELGEKTFVADNDDDCVIAGETNLVSYDDLADMAKLRDLFNTFNDKREMLQLLDHTMSAEGVQIFIGRESGHEVFDDVSLITASYHADDKAVGVLGVIGPKRMPYDRVIPVVDITARLLSATLKTDSHK